MARTHKIEKARRVFAQIKEADIHPIFSGDGEFVAEFMSVSERHGNRRKAMAVMKKKERKAGRYAERAQAFRDADDEAYEV